MRGKLNIPILAYHHVLPANARIDESIKRSPFTVSDSQFYNQMLFLSQNGYQPISFESFLKTLYTSGHWRDDTRPIVITFDDGWADNFEHAFPVLKSFKFPATFFVITSYVGSAGCMSWSQLLEMQTEKMQIESHTHTHSPLALLSNIEMQWELTHSRNLLEERLGKQVNLVSFPHGAYNNKVLKAAYNAGYSACGTSNFGYACTASKIYELPRILIRKNNNISQFARLCEGSQFTFLKGRMLQKSKDLVKDAIGLERYQNLYNIRNRLRRTSAID